MKTLINICILVIFSLNIFYSQAETIKPAIETTDVEIVKVLNSAEVYPNPAENYIYLKIDDQNLSSDVKIEVMSIIGNKMHASSEKIKAGLYKVNLKSIPSGHYYVMLTIDSEKSLKKFLKK